MYTSTYKTTDQHDNIIEGKYTVWPNGNSVEIEYTYPDGDPARWTSVAVYRRDRDGVPVYWKGHADLRPRQHDAIIDAIRKSELLPPRIVHPA